MAINDFLSVFKNGMRANRFKVSIDGIDSKLQFLCRSTSIPNSDITPITIPFMGQNISIPGDRVGDRIWNVEIFVDVDFKIRSELEIWQNLVRPEGLPGGLDVAAAVRTATIDLLDTNEETIRSYRMLKCWPSSLGEIALSHDSENTVASYSCDFSFFSWTTLF